jgi:hypothetical protein
VKRGCKFLLRDERIRKNLIDYINRQRLTLNFLSSLRSLIPTEHCRKTHFFSIVRRCQSNCNGLVNVGTSQNGRFFVSGHAVATGKPGEVVPGIEGSFAPFVKAPQRWVLSA